MFCRVDITASGITNAFVIPRTALHDENTVFLAEDGRLARRQVKVARFRHDEAVIGAGLQAGDRLVVSVLSAPVAGMQLRPLEAGSQATDGGLTSQRPSSDGRN
jgi:multidrug efflux pump subunit AcrA (membrane-fusion protein)